MVAHEPQIAALDHDRFSCGRLGDGVGPGIALNRLLGPDQQVDLGCLEAGDGDIEIDLEFAQDFELLSEQRLVPAGIQRQLVVSDNVGLTMISKPAPTGTTSPLSGVKKSS